MLNGKYKCIGESKTGCMTEGRVYEFAKGKTTWDNGEESWIHESIDELFNTMKIKIEKVLISPKDMLFNGAMCKTRGGDIIMYMELKNTKFFSSMCIPSEGTFIGRGGWNISNYYGELENSSDSSLDIMEIRTPNCIGSLHPTDWNLNGALIWKRGKSEKEKLEDEKKERIFMLNIELNKLKLELKELQEEI